MRLRSFTWLGSLLFGSAACHAAWTGRRSIRRRSNLVGGTIAGIVTDRSIPPSRCRGARSPSRIDRQSGRIPESNATASNGGMHRSECRKAPYRIGHRAAAVGNAEPETGPNAHQQRRYRLRVATFVIAVRWALAGWGGIEVDCSRGPQARNLALLQFQRLIRGAELCSRSRHCHVPPTSAGDASTCGVQLVDAQQLERRSRLAPRTSGRNRW